MTTKKQVIEYLEKNPKFFDENLAVLYKMEIPHPKGVGTVSLLERQIQSAREQIDILSEDLVECIALAEFNYLEQMRVYQFILKLLGAKNEANIKSLFEEKFVKEFDLLEINLIKTTKKHNQVLRYLEDDVFFGQLEKEENSLLFTKKNQSIALCGIGNNAKYGLLVFSASDERFLEDELSTELLIFIAKITEFVFKKL